MRVIAGEFRGRKLLPPEGDTTRPITDRAKQSLFDVLSPLIEESVVYDCFAGTGSMGLECLSRGAAHVTFFEADRSALSRLRKNIETLKVEDRSTIMAGDLFKHLSTMWPANKASLLFLDPPYRFLKERPADLQALAKNTVDRHLSPTATLIFRHDAADQLDLPPFEVYDQRRYGSMALDLLRPTAT
jgi:16S rRNA (guanine966-N2)-methyltransferase